MTQETTTFLLRGGLNLVTPPIAMPAGTASASINYVSDVSGYSVIGGYERFDGRQRPSDSDDPGVIAARRAAITAVPGVGTVRGVHVYAGSLYAFRDHASDGTSRMFKSTNAGWVEQTFGYELTFDTGTQAFAEGDTITGGTSSASGVVERAILRTGAFGDGDATGYLILSGVSGTFEAAETITGTVGSAKVTAAQSALTLPAGGIYDFTTHNFYGSAKTPRMYFCNGQGNAWEWDGEVLSIIKTGNSSAVDTDNLLAQNGDDLLAANGDLLVLGVGLDKPDFVTHYKNHLFLGYSAGSIVNSSIGEPLEYITTTGAGEISFGARVSGLITAAATSLLILGENRIDYLTGSSTEDFVSQPLSEGSGAIHYSAQYMGQPIYLDDAGIRALTTTSAFGDWTSGTLTQAIEPLLTAKREAGVLVTASVLVRAKDQYRLFWNDGSGIALYNGRKQPESMPFKLPVIPYCACSGEFSSGEGDRIFIGATDGYVYEMERGRSFDGAAIEAYIRLPFNSIGMPSMNKRFMKFSAEISGEDNLTLGMAFDTNYAAGIDGEQTLSVDEGGPIISTAVYDSVDFSTLAMGELTSHIAAIGKNIAVTIISDASDKLPHTLATATFNYAKRGMVR